MPMDDEADDDVAGSVPPLPPDDRLWRHPSEVSTWGAGAAARPGTPPRDGPRRPPAWPTAVAAALAGAAVFGAALAVTGHLSTADPRRVVERVAVTPVVSSPMVRGGSGVDALVDLVGPAVAGLVVTREAGSSHASAVVVRDDGLLFTSAHQVVGATAILVVLADGRQLDGELVGADLATDVAVVSIEADHLTVAILGSVDHLGVGTPVMAMGASDGPGRPSVATGVVSALDRRLDTPDASLHGMIQTDAPVEAGWAGGPLVDATGAVVGVTTGLVGDGAPFGFATPIDLVRGVAEDLMASGSVRRAWLGIEGADLDDEQQREHNLTGGVVVIAVTAGSPAAHGGLAPGDVITDLDGQAVRSSSGLVLAMRRLQPGDGVAVGYWRDGIHGLAAVTVGQGP